jgi:hypothetical protein
VRAVGFKKEAPIRLLRIWLAALVTLFQPLYVDDLKYFQRFIAIVKMQILGTNLFVLRADPVPGCAIDLFLNPSNISTRVQIRPAGAHHINMVQFNPTASLLARTYQITDNRVILLARDAPEILDSDVGDGQVAGIFFAEGKVSLPITLRDLNSIVDI